MDRREFFKAGGRKAAEVVVRLADERATQRAKQWLRPPYAKPELEFLLSCTRCDACMAVCPHEVIFTLPALYGVEAAGTPALDLSAGSAPTGPASPPASQTLWSWTKARPGLRP